MAPRPIFIHGAGGGAALWDQQEPRFEGCFVVALPGHPTGIAMQSVGAYAEWTADAIREIAGPRVLVGHSMGGAIALQIAMDHPELVDGVVIIASGPRLFVPDSAFALAKSDFAAECERLLRKGWEGADDETLLAEATSMIANGQETLVRDYTACRAYDVTDRLGEVDLPVLVIAGSTDRLTPPTLSEEIADAIPGAISIVVPDGGHWLMKEQAPAIDLLIAGFLARVELGGE